MLRCLTLLLLTIGAAAFGVLYFLRSPAVTNLMQMVAPGVTATATPPPVSPTPPGRAPAGPGVISYTIDEETLTRQVNTTLAGQPLGDTPFGPATVRSLTIRLQDSGISATGTAQAGPVALPVSLAGAPMVQNGQLRITVSQATIGGVPLPATVLRQIESLLQGQADALLGNLRVRITTVTTGDGALTVSGTPT